jgi:hypothetical protein
MATFKPNRAGLREYLRGSDYVPALELHARVIEARAQSYAHVESALSAAGHNRTPGKFRDSIHTEKHTGPSRHTVRVVADCDGAAAIEARDRALGRAAG